jgi:hypothetical protein
MKEFRACFDGETNGATTVTIEANGVIFGVATLLAIPIPSII